MNVANTFCNSYRAIPRPSGNAKIDFPENYVRDLASADIGGYTSARTQERTFVCRYVRGIRTERDSALGMQRVQRSRISGHVMDGTIFSVNNPG